MSLSYQSNLCSRFSFFIFKAKNSLIVFFFHLIYIQSPFDASIHLSATSKEKKGVEKVLKFVIKGTEK